MPNTIAKIKDLLPVLIHVVATELLDSATWLVAAYGEAGEVTDFLQTSSGSIEGALVILASVFLFLLTVVGQFCVAFAIDVFVFIVLFLFVLQSCIKVFLLLHIEVRKIALFGFMFTLVVLVWYL